MAFCRMMNVVACPFQMIYSFFFVGDVSFVILFGHSLHMILKYYWKKVDICINVSSISALKILNLETLAVESSLMLFSFKRANDKFEN